MPTVVTIDKAGRIVIPRDVRKARGLAAGTQFLLVEGRDGRLWLQKLDAAELARKIREEMKGVDLRPLLKKVKTDIEALARERYPSLRR